MPESVGKRLHDVRIQRGLSIEEVAHATKLRPDKIEALEHDDFARFASNAYAKGFLQIYGRYLGVDVAEAAKQFDTASRICVTDYQYLSNGVQQREPQKATFSFIPKRQVPSIVPLVAFVALLVLAAMGYQLYRNWLRVTGDPGFGAGQRTTGETPATAQTQPQPQPAAPSTPAPREVAPADARFIPRAEAVNPAVAAAVPAPAPVAAGPVVNEVLIEPVRKTWITVRRDDPKSAPVFEDFLYPGVRPLKVKGPSIFIDARDPGAIVIRKNGAPIAYAPGTEIR